MNDITVANPDLISLPVTVRSPATLTFAPDNVSAVALLDLISLPVTVKSPTTSILVPLMRIAGLRNPPGLLPLISFPSTSSLFAIETLLSLRVIAVCPVLDLMSLPATVRSPSTLTFAPLSVSAVTTALL